jgi:hypothetical protein
MKFSEDVKYDRQQKIPKMLFITASAKLEKQHRNGFVFLCFFSPIFGTLHCKICESHLQTTYWD